MKQENLRKKRESIIITGNDMIEYSVRFLGVSASDIDKFKINFSQEKIRVGKYFKNDGTYVVVINAYNYSDLEEINNFIVNNSGYDKDLFVSIVSSLDSDIVELPGHIIDFISISKIKVNISFTVVFDD